MRTRRRRIAVERDRRLGSELCLCNADGAVRLTRDDRDHPGPQCREPQSEDTKDDDEEDEQGVVRPEAPEEEARESGSDARNAKNPFQWEPVG